MTGKQLLFLTTANLASNPRLVKEIDLFSKANKITVLLFKLGNWSDAINEEMMSNRTHIQFIQLDVTRSKYLKWLFWAVLEKKARMFWPILKQSIWLTALAQTRRSIMLLTKGNHICRNTDLIIAHNPGALYPAYALSKKWKTPFIYDIEDYDPGIDVPNGGSHYIPVCERMLKNCLPQSKALTSASPLIEEYTLALIGGHPNHSVILNSFPSDEFIPPLNREDKILKLVWFSQTISFGRGLEQLFAALLKIYQSEEIMPVKEKPEIHVTLIGNLDPSFEQEIIVPFLKSLNDIEKSDKPKETEKASDSPLQSIAIGVSKILTILPPMAQSQLHAELANYDIGMALELDNTDLNRGLCLTNKIIAYAQAGLYLLATDTPAQKQFMEEDSDRGIICGQRPVEIAKILDNLLSQKEELINTRSNRFKQGRELSWEKESEKLKQIWQTILST
ncbi:glycosyltransferase family protein [Alkalitalea saponilacus]|uniref:Glycosyltransferase involved in cell wall bisynthesis n=1 Tax=Alkalitalea saponilacus TaxID=889453 RepID=A0A1T5GZW3_9BACT|nr:hypothetical protein [Alkalitalea saponilacus]ASB50966.1 hypothetical protein CDL62_18340 [Alkalitalea saponilacus]SKC13871.1 Glycosyltransferase involved in cell wall bisynthesis [Alkalitalea saponilacus]